MSVEMQNAYALSCATFNYGGSDVAKLVGQGLNVVALVGPAYCPFTDARLPGDQKIVAGAYMSRRIAELKASRINAEMDEAGGCEGWAEVFPSLPRPPQPVLAYPGSADMDDIPF